MANTLLNVSGRGTVQAGNNPQNNIAQVNSQATVQPVTSNVNTTQGIQPTTQNTTSQDTQQTISPITIPIQLQPQITTTGQQQTTTNQQQSVQGLSVAAQSEEVTAPTPQTYQQEANTHTVNFDQIYNQYQSAFGSNPSSTSQGSSGIKKTSLNTTIVTPTTQNLNSVEGMYQSAYSNTINSLISQMIIELNQGFQYDPNSDEALKLATEYAANTTLQSLAGSGVLNSTATSERVARIVSELIPQYEEKAHDRYLDYLNQLANTAQIVMDYDSQQFQVWKDAKDREFQEKEFEYQKQQDALENAWKRVDELGYVDNNASTILGVPVGTLSGEARLAKEEREFELQKMREQAELEYQNNKALYELKNQLDIEQSKTLTDYEYSLQEKYGGTKSSSDDELELYEDIIKNRFGEYDEFNKLYQVSDKTGAYNYLKSAYANGQISSSTASILIDKYGLNNTETEIGNRILEAYKTTYNQSTKSDYVKETTKRQIEDLYSKGLITQADKQKFYSELGL